MKWIGTKVRPVEEPEPGDAPEMISNPGLMMGKKACYGVLDRVFPLGPEGWRQVPPRCLECEDRVSCLKEAINTREGLEMRTQLIEKAERGGLIGRFQRWSQKKHLSRQTRERKEK